MLSKVSFGLLCYWLSTTAIIVSGTMYSKSDAVINLSPDNFKKNVLSSNGIVFVEFYAPWCGHCKSLAPEWKKAAKALDGIVKFAAVDADQHKSLGSKYGVQGFPTIKIFTDKSSTPVDYSGARTSSALVDHALSLVKKVVKKRSGSSSSSSSTSSKKKKKKSTSNKSSVTTLTDSNFNDIVMESSELWVVEFYAPWCGHCKALEPEYKAAAKELRGSGVKLGMLDATVHQSAASTYGIKGFPTLKVFNPGSTSPSDAKDYNGPRTADGIVTYALDALEKSGGMIIQDIPQISSSTVLSDTCYTDESNSICVLTFLPPMLDHGGKASTRDGYIKTLMSVAKEMRAKSRSVMFNYGWLASGGESHEVITSMEEAFGLSFGFPAVVAINVSKNRYAVMKGSFSVKSIKTFLNGLVSGSVKTDELSNESVLTTEFKAPVWDGKDVLVETLTDDDDDEAILREMKEEL